MPHVLTKHYSGPVRADDGPPAVARCEGNPLILHATCLTLAMLGLTAQAADTVVVCPKVFHSAMRPWFEHRCRQGHKIELVDAQGSPERIRADIRRVAKGGALRFVVLVGDTQPARGNDQGVRARTVPTHFALAKVNIRFGSGPDIATDNWYADLDDDRVPDVAIGRLSADSPQEVTALVAKILAYERAAGDDVWRRRINLVAGLGGFGSLADTALEAGAKSILTEGIPPAYATSLTHAGWRSPYCPVPANFGETTVDRLNDGCWFWVYIGHGQTRELDRVPVPGGQYHILGAGDVGKLRAARGAPIVLFLACYTGAYDLVEDCLAEEMLRAQGGPVAVLCGSRVTMPYAMSVLGMGLLKECFHERRETIGEVLLYAKRNMVFAPRDDERSRQLDALAATLNPDSTDLAEERLEHLDLFNLLSDPLLRLRHPREAVVEAVSPVAAGERLKVHGMSPLDGEALVELVVRRDRLTFRPPGRVEFSDSPESAAEFQATYEKANDPRLASRRVKVEHGRYETELEVPEGAWGECHVRVFVQGRAECATGAADVTVRRAIRSAKKP
ncbi:MAG TPA: C25 family cysteine peptidase [Pirellulales bacterium]|nr:C25 family cysteine peptidase [Pirellulales bacterium]